MKVWPNKPDAVNPVRTIRFAIEARGRRVTDLDRSPTVMKSLLILFSVLNCGELLAEPAKFPTWNELCYLLEVKKESKVFREFCRHWGVHEFSKGKDSFGGPGGVMINCAGDTVVIVG